MMRRLRLVGYVAILTQMVFHAHWSVTAFAVLVTIRFELDDWIERKATDKLAEEVKVELVGELLKQQRAAALRKERA